MLNNCLSETNIGVQTSSDSGTTLSNLMNVLERLNDSLFALFKLVNIGSKLLP